jgi:integrase
LTAGDVETMMNSLHRAGRSPRTIQAARNAVSRLLRDAKREGLVKDVVTINVSHARRMIDDEEEPTSKALDPGQVRKLFEACAGTRWEPLLVMLALLGLRRGEALGLAWSDVDFDLGVITIRRSLTRVTEDGHSRLVLSPTKTKSSRRPLAMPTMLATLLRSWRAEQMRQRLKAGQHWGAEWTEESVVFTTPLGTPVDPDNLRHALDHFGRVAGIGHVYPHQLRHSVASVLISSGHTAPEVAKVLGHSSPAVTLTYYAHAFDVASVRAIGTVAEAYGSLKA